MRPGLNNHRPQRVSTKTASSSSSSSSAHTAAATSYSPQINSRSLFNFYACFDVRIDSSRTNYNIVDLIILMVFTLMCANLCCIVLISLCLFTIKFVYVKFNRFDSTVSFITFTPRGTAPTPSLLRHIF